MDNKNEVNKLLSKVSQVLMDNLIFHSEYANFFAFLNMRGNKRQHENEYIANIIKTRQIDRRITDMGMIPIPPRFEEDSPIIPSDWLSLDNLKIGGDYTKAQIHQSYKRYIEQMCTTRDIFSKISLELSSLGDLASYELVKSFALHVEDDIKYIKREYAHFVKADDILWFLEMQDAKHDSMIEELRDIASPLYSE